MSTRWFLPLALMLACAPQDGDEDPDVDHADAAPGVAVAPIIGGTLATSYPEAAIVDIDRGSSGTWYACSGTLIAPRAVLTAGHCIDGHSKWAITVLDQTRVSTSALTYDWAEGGAELVNPMHHDLGLVFLDDPIALDAYPTLASAPLPNASSVVNIGRILDGTFTWSSYQASVIVQSAASAGYPFDYISTDIIQPGDSGGAVMADGTHLLVAVNSGAGGGIQVLARVDLLKSWIDAQVAAHAPAPPPPPPPPPPATNDCPADIEPNGAVASATPFDRRVCGALATSSDTDWLSFTTPRGATTLTLSTGDDAVFAIGKLAYGRCTVLASGRKSVRVTTSARATSLCVRVSSPAHHVQSYTFKASGAS